MSGLQFSARQFPQHAVEWLHEIADAYRDAHDTLPFMPLVGVMPSENQLFHLAPRVAVKFRGLPHSRVDAATEAALSSYVASQEQAGGVFDDPRLAFVFCYLASHFGLDLISEEYVDEVMSFLEENQARLAELAGLVRLPIEARATTGLSFATGGKCQTVDNSRYLIAVTAALQIMMHSHL
jgi:hypothetical protein